MTVWSLVNKTVSYITNPKNVVGGLQVSPDKEYLAVAERRDCKDSISLIETTSWQFVKVWQADFFFYIVGMHFVSYGILFVWPLSKILFVL